MYRSRQINIGKYKIIPNVFLNDKIKLLGFHISYYTDTLDFVLGFFFIEFSLMIWKVRP